MDPPDPTMAWGSAEVRRVEHLVRYLFSQDYVLRICQSLCPLENLLNHSQIKVTVPGGVASLTSLADNENACLKLAIVEN